MHTTMDITLAQAELNIPKLDIEFFEEIATLLRKSKEYQTQEKECRRKIEKYEKSIQAAEEIIEKAKAKRDALMERNEFLKNCINDRECAQKRALKYWSDFGIEVEQLDGENQYEFTFSKLPCNTTRQETTTCKVHLSYQDGVLEIVEQIPEFIGRDNLAELNRRLTENCITPGREKTDLVDYKLAMLMIRKDLLKNLASVPRISSHLPTGTNNHICT